MDSNTSFEYEYESNYYDTGLCNYDEVINFRSHAVPMLLSTVVVLSLVGNILVLVILGLYESLKSSTNIFILNLALSDLLFTLGLAFWAYNHIWSWTLGSGMCNAITFVSYAGFYSGILFLMAMSIQRYLAVVHQLSNWDRGQNFAVLPIIVWLISIISALPAVLQSSHLNFCSLISITCLFRQNIYYVLDFLVMIFCYVRILQITIKSLPHQKHLNLRLFFCIGVLFLVFWAPYNIITFLATLQYYFTFFTECNLSIGLAKAFYVSEALAYSYCCMKPFCYFLLDIKFRNHLKSILRGQQVRNSPQMSVTTDHVDTSV